ncbi:MAG: hydrogenase formation protein HypD [Bacillota bacterium]
MATVADLAPDARNPDLVREFRRPDLARAILDRIKARLTGAQPLRLMEVCGTHTVAISRSGLRSLLGPEVDLVSGPGCPVCVTSQGDIDAMLELAGRPGVIVATFGDMVRVPGSRCSLLEARAAGARVEVVYSALDAVRLAVANRGDKVVFLGVGFETTTPGTALAIETAEREGVPNFLVYAAHKLVPPALAALMTDPELGIDGLVLPGHVSVVIGRRAYLEPLAARRVPAAIAGFEPVDILLAVDRVAEMLGAGRTEVANTYARAVTEEGNPLAQAAIERCFGPVTATWRGLGEIPGSGLVLRSHLVARDAREKLGVTVREAPDPPGCSCGDVLRGKIKPPACPLFGGPCSPTAPVGPCMVSTEGACAAYYRYERGEDGAGDGQPQPRRG